MATVRYSLDYDGKPRETGYFDPRDGLPPFYFVQGELVDFFASLIHEPAREEFSIVEAEDGTEEIFYQGKRVGIILT